MSAYVNILITVIISPIINEKRNNITYKKEKLYEASVELVDYTADIMGAKKPKQEMLDMFRKCCLQIHLLFDSGKAFVPIDSYMEDIYMFFYHCYHDNIKMNRVNKQIIRELIRKIRVELAYYIEKGVKKEKKCETVCICIENRQKCRNTLVIGELDASEGIYVAKYEDGNYMIRYFREIISQEQVETKVKQLIAKYGEMG